MPRNTPLFGFCGPFAQKNGAKIELLGVKKDEKFYLSVDGVVQKCRK